MKRAQARLWPKSFLATVGIARKYPSISLELSSFLGYYYDPFALLRPAVNLWFTPFPEEFP